jgi:hypothetical protein
MVHVHQFTAHPYQPWAAWKQARHADNLDPAHSRAQGEEYDRLWKFVTERHPPYLNYQKMTARHIPLMVFEPVI